MVQNELTVCSRYFFMSFNLHTVLLLKYVTSTPCPEKNINTFDRCYMKSKM